MALVKIYKRDNSITLEKDGSGGLYYGSEINIYWYDELESVNISYREKNTGVVSYQEVLNESGLQAAATYELTKEYLRDVMTPCECGGDSGDVEWGSITGTIGDQSDLQAELDNKENKSPITQIGFADSPYLASYGEDLEIDCSGGDVIVNLPTAISNNGNLVIITRVDVSINTLSIQPTLGQFINGLLIDLIANQWTSNRYKSNGSNISKR